ncbi:MAG: TRAP transporter small permease [Candidatus Atribacteria bacterium]|nr:TRAP transporter small permease [Candidatus Atribacteria bacterium]
MKDFYIKMCNIEIVLAIICLLLSVFIIVISAIMRKIGMPINWGLDIALLLFTWSTFLGADIAFRDDKFINVDILFLKMPKSLQRPLELVIYITIFIFLSALIYLGAILSVFTWPRTFQGIPTLSYTWVTLSVPVCSFFMIITTVIKMFKKFNINAKRLIE